MSVSKSLDCEEPFYAAPRQAHDVSGPRIRPSWGDLSPQNRLTHWANGNDTAFHPRSENIDLLVLLTLMYNLNCSDQTIMDMCREVIVPSLWEDMEDLF